MTRVCAVEAIPVSYPEPNDFNALRHLCLVKLTTDDGLVGWGESITQFAEANLATQAIVDGMADLVTDHDPLRNEAIWRSLKDRAWWYGYGGGIASFAVSAIDMGLWDLKGKILGEPVVRVAGRSGTRAFASRRFVPRPLRIDPGDGLRSPGLARQRTARG